MIIENLPSRRLFRPLNQECPAVLGIGTAVPENSYTQDQFKRLFGVKNPVVNRLIDAGHIEKRHLYLPEPGDDGTLREETSEELILKFKNGVLDIGVRAALRALASEGLKPQDVDYLVCVTSSGFVVPGVSSLVSRALAMRSDIHRSDVVGMGCNAGLSALYSISAWSKANPDKLGLLLCCEVNSASYVRDETVRTGIVNSLFGDGAVAILIGGRQLGKRRCRPSTNGPVSRISASKPRLHLFDFESLNITDQHDSMRFDWDGQKQKWSFFLSRDIPFVIGRNLHRPVEILLSRNGLDKLQVQHWVLHTGGGAVIDGAVKSLGIDEEAVRHTRSVLRDYGNLSSGSFLFSLERLIEEGTIREGEVCVLIAMGPGATIEAGLGIWM